MRQRYSIDHEGHTANANNLRVVEIKLNTFYILATLYSLYCICFHLMLHVIFIKCNNITVNSNTDIEIRVEDDPCFK